MKKDNFDLSEFLTDSLSLQSQGPTRYIYKVKDEDVYLKLLDQDPLDIIGERFFGPKLVEERVVDSPIQEFYGKRIVFITGGTGFVGKILIDKLIRYIPNIGKIYILIRRKRGKSPLERFNVLMDDPVFLRMKTEVPEYAGKISFVEGDITLPGLGLSVTDRQMLIDNVNIIFNSAADVFLRMKTEVPEYAGKISFVEGDITLPGLGLSVTDRQMLIDNVNIIFNSAADVRFIEPLRSSLTSNVLGSRHVLDLAKEVKDLRRHILHIPESNDGNSLVWRRITEFAYSQCVRRNVPEAVPRLPVYNYKEVIDIITSKTDSELQSDMWKLMQGWPNTYTFTKAVCEEMLVEEGNDLPLCIFRPSIVANTYKEPVRGWTDNLYGPIGMFTGSALGVLHSFPLNLDLHCELVPVDFVVNCIMAAAWRTNELRNNTKLLVYNYTASPEKLLTWKKATDIGLKYRDSFPLYSAIYYTSFYRTSSKLLDRTIHIFFHKVPGKIFDSICQLVGVEPRLSKVYDKISILKEPLEWFSGRVWQFEKENVYALSRSMSEEDQRMFQFDVVDIDFIRYFLQSTLGVRYYYLKEKMETLPAARLKNHCFRLIHFSLKASCYYAALKCLAYTAHYVPF